VTEIDHADCKHLLRLVNADCKHLLRLVNADYKHLLRLVNADFKHLLQLVNAEILKFYFYTIDFLKVFPLMLLLDYKHILEFQKHVMVIFLV
jgi:hypothetical protein